MSLASILASHPLAKTANYRIAEHLEYQYDPKKYPYYGYVPRGKKENAEFRWKLKEAAREDYMVAGDLWEACAQDLLFYVSFACMTYDPRLTSTGMDPSVPFIPWAYQDYVFGEIQDALGHHNLNIHKSRDVGVSWMVLTTIDHAWRFDNRSLSFLLVSAKEDLVDWKGNPDTLFAKFDFIDRYLPAFLMPQGGTTRFNLHRENADTGSVINGAASTGNVGRAGRRTAIYLDEFAAFPRGEDEAALAATQKSTNSRIFTSTPAGEGTAQAGLRHRKNIKTIAVHWSEHPECSKGMYRWDSTQNAPEVIDVGHKFELGYVFKRDGKWRSPYKDFQDDLMGVPWLSDQELDISYQAESRPFFDGTTLDRLAVECRNPVFEGDADIDEETKTIRGLRAHKGGPLRLWIKPERPQLAHPFAIGADVCAGTAGNEASNSVLSIWDVRKCVQVGEYVIGDKTPEDFARIAVAFCRWFGGTIGESTEGAMLIWENQGPGGSFGVKVVQYEYGNIYYRKSNEQDVRKKPSFIPGFTAGRTSKLIIFSEFRRAISCGEAITWSKDAVQEARYYRYIDSTNSGVEFGGAGGAMGKLECGANHGDRVSAQCLAWKLVIEHELYPKKKDSPDAIDADPDKPKLAPSLSERHKERRKEDAVLASDWY